jgi:hypothetical protein
VAVFAMAAISAGAQWGTNGTHIYNTNTGYVGIGTNNPTSILDIYSPSTTPYLQVGSPYSGSGNPIYNIGVLQLKNTSSGDLYYIGIRKSTLGTEAIQSVYDATTTTWRAFSYFNVNTRKYEIRSGVGNAEFLNSGNFTFSNTGNVLLNNTGSVGIGMGAVAIPSGVKLAVNGKINCKEVEVTLTGWSDFVFNDNYNLKSLNYVESFIKENKHLPGVPSEKEVIEKGVNLGEMDAILLKKIEELTLYMIELKKENEDLKSKLNKIEANN